jgi:hypothetical protein
MILPKMGLKVPVKSLKIRTDLLKISIPEKRSKVQPPIKMWRALNCGLCHNRSGELLCTPVIREHGLRSLAGKDHYGQLAQAQLFPIAENLKILKVFDVDLVGRHLLVGESPFQPGLEFDSLRKDRARLVQTLVNHEFRAAKLSTRGPGR